ncbi:MAG TPA: ABC transporter ATP-binding protein [Solirubrobacterales bacterium]|jgi:ABC-type multidrug transport system fused ATPase/permease subunit|nr:ABC transporter ATP-binding protein [Solirubrobacterales bacterium]
MSPTLGPLRMRSRPDPEGAPSEQPKEHGAWDLWKRLPRMRPYLAPYRKTLYALLALTVLAAVFGLAEPWPLAVILNQVLEHEKDGGIVETIFGPDPDTAFVLISMVLLRLGIIVAGNGFTVWNHFLGSRMEQNMVLDLRSDLFAHVQRLSLTFHDKRQTGALMSQINLQAAAVGNVIMVIPPLIEAGLTLIGMFAIALLLDWQIAIFAMIILPFLLWSFGLYGKRIVPRLQRVQQLEWQSLSIVNEAMAMMRVIVSFGREDHEHKRFREQGQTAVDERVKLTVSQSLYTLGVQTITAAGVSAVMGLGAWHVIQGKLSVGEMIVLITYISSVYQPLEQISTTVGMVHEQLVQFDASLKLLDTEPEVVEREDAVELGRARGHLTARGVAFAYPGRQHTLTDISFDAEAGERIAVVGHTGAGKSTLMSLLVRFYDPSGGRIEIDGVDLRDLKLRSLREQISVVLQEPLLFSGTIGENIRYGRLEATQEEIEDAARAANAHDFIVNLPNRYDTELGEGGSQISGGERQRISVARAFLKDAPILILDEPTSSIDSRTEGVILDALDELMEGKTSFIVAHRLSTVRHADQILVLNEGRIVERGTHEELLEHGPIYRQLHAAQNRERRRRRAGQNGNGAKGGSRSAPERAVVWRQVTEGSGG